MMVARYQLNGLVGYITKQTCLQMRYVIIYIQ